MSLENKWVVVNNHFCQARKKDILLLSRDPLENERVCASQFVSEIPHITERQSLAFLVSK